MIGFPLVVTFFFTRQWMDGRRSWRFWTSQVGCFAILLLLPQTLWLATFAEPTMPAAFQEKLAIEAATLAQQPQTSVSFSSANTSKNAVGDYNDRVLATLREKLVDLDSSKRWELPDSTIPILVGEIVSSRLQIGESKDRYNESLGFLSSIVHLLRQSPKLSDQDWCDILENFLLRECLQEGARESISSELYDRLVAQLSDEEGRYRSRRQAIVLSWYRLLKIGREHANDSTKWLNNEGRASLGGHSLYFYDRSKSHRQFPVVMRRASFVTYEMLDCLELGRSRAENRKVMLERLYGAWGIDDRRFRFRPHIPIEVPLYLPTTPLPSHSIGYPSHIPCSLWYGDWESMAKTLKSDTFKQPTSSFSPLPILMEVVRLSRQEFIGWHALRYEGRGSAACRLHAHCRRL